jgi:hypothetical protein
MDVLAPQTPDLGTTTETTSIPENTRKREKRKAKRDSISGSLTILWGPNSQEERISRATLIDLSDRGAKFRVGERIPAGSWLMFNYHQLGASGRGTVRYCQMVKSSYNVGVEFSGGTGWNPASNRFATELRNLSIAIDRLEDPDAA